VPKPVKPIRIPLSVYQQARFAELRGEIQGIKDRQSEAVTAIVSRDHDPSMLAQGWTVSLESDAIVCTPSAPAPTA
jgi:hypothetical protein